MRTVGVTLAGLSFAPANAQDTSIVKKLIPTSGELLPVIGMGSWQTFDVGNNESHRQSRAAVLQRFFDDGGGLIDSSPMYGSSESVIGACLKNTVNRNQMFSATKVWTPGRKIGMKQMENSQTLWGVEHFDLMQIHNLVDWKTHQKTLSQWKEEGRIRYAGLTTSHGRKHNELLLAMRQPPFDFVQLTYNMIDREAENRLLPMAADTGVAVIVNRPFRRAALFNRVQGKPLPEWAGEIGCANWAQFFLKFVVSHPAVTCAIPATSRVDHMAENMGAAYGVMPDAGMRQRMLRYFEAI